MLQLNEKLKRNVGGNREKKKKEKNKWKEENKGWSRRRHSTCSGGRREGEKGTWKRARRWGRGQEEEGWV